MYIKNTKIIFGISLVLVIAGFVVAIILGKQQDQQFKDEQALYDEVVALHEAGQSEDALKTLLPLQKKYIDNEKITRLASRITYETGHYDEAARYTQQVIDINPYAVEDAAIMLRLGVSYFYNQQADRAKVVFERILADNLSLESMPDYQDQVQNYLAQIPNE